MIYLDNSATTKPYDDVVQTYMKVASSFFGNPSSLHSLGMQAEELINEARKRMAYLLRIKENELYFTSGGTEGNNIAIKGAVYARKNRGTHLITTKVEHSSVYECFRQLEREGFQVTYIPVNNEGRVNVQTIAEAIRPDTTFVSIIHVNNEVGTIQPIEEIGTLLTEYPTICFHVDHVQGVAKVPLSLKNVHLCTGSAHKFHGMKGNGFLYVRENVNIKPLFYGGQQENGLRAGTENVAGIVSMAQALRLAFEQKEDRSDALAQVKANMMERLQTIPGVILNTPKKDTAPHIVHFSVPPLKPEVIVQSLAAKNIFVSTQSACSSKLEEPSRILTAMGFNKERATSGIRVSLSYETTKAEVDTFIYELTRLIPELLEVVTK